jgi:hypothetical protein
MFHFVVEIVPYSIELSDIWIFRVHQRFLAEPESSCLAPTIFAFVNFFFNGVDPTIENFDYYRL